MNPQKSLDSVNPGSRLRGFFVAAAAACNGEAHDHEVNAYGM
jgi:hypothetical protein